MKKTRPVFTPPVQVSHLYYRLARILVWGGLTRYHKVQGAKALTEIPPAGTPAIFVSNHQNGMMDPLVSCAFVPQQIHWLTRADVFWNGAARHIMYGFNQMPIYRQRDRMEDIRHRNDIIFNVCVDRLHAGAAMGIFPEGNHNPFPSLREFKGGLAELLARSARTHESLKHIAVMPVGVEYEDYSEFRRQLRVRTGPAVPFHDLLLEDGTLDKTAFNARLRGALAELVVDIQPADAQPYLHPAVRAARPTELEGGAWLEMSQTLDQWAKRWASDESWADGVKSAHEAWQATQGKAFGRPEAWGRSPQDIRNARVWTRILTPLAWLANVPTWPTELLIRRFVAKTVRKAEFVSTMRIGYGILLFPLTWFLTSLLAGGLAPDGSGWLAAGAMWVWGQGGSRFYAWAQSEKHGRADAKEGESFWHDNGRVNQRKAWQRYLEAVHA
jgi:1-acyl-sn-glycerol-3-phosphate acyltransferase